VLDEAERLNRYIQNLLDMTRFGQQPFRIAREWVDLNDLISSAIARLGSVLGPLEVNVDVAADAALLEVQGALIEQVIVNLLDNAAGFAPAGSAIEIRASRRDGTTWIEVANDGPVIPEAESERIFDMFYRAAQGDRTRPGAGLGLAICRSIVAAHGGTIAAGARADGTGALLRIALPQAGESVLPAA
jgi:two-component system sensor histidine kinase KdpD